MKRAQPRVPFILHPSAFILHQTPARKLLRNYYTAENTPGKTRFLRHIARFFARSAPRREPRRRFPDATLP